MPENKDGFHETNSVKYALFGGEVVISVWL